MDFRNKWMHFKYMHMVCTNSYFGLPSLHLINIRSALQNAFNDGSSIELNSGFVQLYLFNNLVFEQIGQT